MDKDKKELARAQREERRSFRARGRSFFMLGSALLLAFSGYELGVRMESIIPFMKTLYNMIIGESIPLSRALTYVDSAVYGILETLLFLACCFLLGMLCLFLRNRTAASFAILPAALALMVYASGMADPLKLNLWQFLKLIPLFMIALGAVTNIVHFFILHSKRKRTGGRNRSEINKRSGSAALSQSDGRLSAPPVSLSARQEAKKPEGVSGRYS